LIDKFLSILISTFNRTNLLKYNLQSILEKNKLDYNYELIILNDGKESIELQDLINIYKDKLNISCIQTSLTKKDINEWRNPGFAVNIGVKKCKGNYIILSCAEIYHLDNSVDEIYKNLNDKKIIITNGKDDNRTVLNMLENNNFFIDYKTYWNLKHLNTNFPFFMGMSKQSFLDIGGFDEEMTGVGYDDNFLVDRLLLSGNKYQLLNECKIIHLWHERPNYINSHRFIYNQQLYKQKKGIIKVNLNKEWGKFEI
jgi:hypothetical protein